MRGFFFALRVTREQYSRKQKKDTSFTRHIYAPTSSCEIGARRRDKQRLYIPPTKERHEWIKGNGNKGTCILMITTMTKITCLKLARLTTYFSYLSNSLSRLTAITYVHVELRRCNVREKYYKEAQYPFILTSEVS